LGVDPFGPDDRARGLFRLNVLVPLDRKAVERMARWDVVLCLEVAEHLRPEDGPLFIEVLSNLAPVVIFSAAVPGQGGEGHVNCQEKAYWQQQFAANGMAEDELATMSLVDHIQGSCPRYMLWLTNNVMVMRRLDALMFDRIASEEAVQAEWIAKWLVNFR
jgi:hypothetical protein